MSASKNSMSIVNLILLVYIIFVWFFTHILDLHGTIVGFLGAPIIMIVPILIGNTIIFILKCDFKNYNPVIYYFFSYLFGISFMTLLFLFMDMMSIFTVKLYFILCFVISLFSLQANTKVINTYDNSSIKYFALAACLGLIQAILITRYSPYPLINSSDIFNHLHYSLMILENSEIIYPKPYLPTFHVIMALALYISNAYLEPLAIFWALRFFLYPLYAIGIYIFALSVVQSRFVSLLSAIIGTGILLIVGGDHGLYNYTPRMTLYILLPYLFYIIYKLFDENTYNEYKSLRLHELGLFLLPLIAFSSVISFFIWHNREFFPFVGLLIASTILLFLFIAGKYKNKDHVLILFSIFLTILFSHNIMGILLIYLIILYLLLFWLNYNKPLSKSFLFLLPIVAFLLIIIQKNEILNFKGLDIFNTLMNQSFEYKYLSILKTLPELVIAFTIFSIIISVKNNKIIPLMSMLSIILILYFLPVSSIMRVFLYAIPFISLLAAYAIYKTINTPIRYMRYKNTSTILLLMVFIPVIIFALYNTSNTNTINFKINYDGTEGYYSHFTYYEYNAGQWIKQNTPKDTLIISDRTTEFIIGGLSNRDIVLGRGNNLMFNEIEIVADILLNPDPKEAFDTIKDISQYGNLTSYSYVYMPENLVEHNKTVIIINGRTTKYLKAYSNSDIFSARQASGMPSNFEHFDGFDKFFNTTYYKLIYSIPNKIYIFEVNNEVQ